MVNFSASQLQKRFGRRVIFDNVSFDLSDTDTLALTGSNGSGKSTLARVIAGVLSRNGGTVQCTIDGKKIEPEQYFQYIGFVSPYLQLYEEFTPLEQIGLLLRLRERESSEQEITQLLQRVNLLHRKDDYIRTFSSGMKQRMKYVTALLHKPPILILDEPTANLDTEGMNMVFDIMDEQKNNGVLIVATNVAAEEERCAKVIRLGQPGGAT